MKTASPAGVTVLMEFHDDWLINILLSDGRVYSFVTECWPEHGCEFTTDGDGPTNWPAAIRTAEAEALDLAARGADTWGLDAIPETQDQFRKAMDFLCRHTSDADFNRFTRS